MRGYLAMVRVRVSLTLTQSEKFDARKTALRPTMPPLPSSFLFFSLTLYREVRCRLASRVDGMAGHTFPDLFKDGHPENSALLLVTRAPCSFGYARVRYYTEHGCAAREHNHALMEGDHGHIRRLHRWRDTV